MIIMCKNQQFDTWEAWEKEMEEMEKNSPITEDLFFNKKTNALAMLNVEEPIDLETYVLISDLYAVEPD